IGHHVPGDDHRGRARVDPGIGHRGLHDHAATLHHRWIDEGARNRVGRGLAQRHALDTLRSPDHRVPAIRASGYQRVVETRAGVFCPVSVPLRIDAEGRRMSGSPLLEVMNLEVVYGRSARAIQGVSFAVSEGAVTSMVGLNGAGKTTTIRAISGFLPTENVQVTDGEIMFDGKSLLGMKPYQTASLGIQVVPERNKVFDTLTVHENLELAWTGRRSDVVLPSYRHPDDVYEHFPFLAAKRQETALVLSGGARQLLAI